MRKLPDSVSPWTRKVTVNSVRVPNVVLNDACCTPPSAGCDRLWPGPVVFVLILLGVFEGFLFALFTCMMFFSQVHAIATDETVRPSHITCHHCQFRGGGGGSCVCVCVCVCVRVCVCVCNDAKAC